MGRCAPCGHTEELQPAVFSSSCAPCSQTGELQRSRSGSRHRPDPNSSFFRKHRSLFPVSRLINAAAHFCLSLPGSVWIPQHVRHLWVIDPATWRPTAAVPSRSLRGWRPSGGRSSLCCGRVSFSRGTVGECFPRRHGRSDRLEWWQHSAAVSWAVTGGFCCSVVPFRFGFWVCLDSLKARCFQLAPLAALAANANSQLGLAEDFTDFYLFIRVFLEPAGFSGFIV